MGRRRTVKPRRGTERRRVVCGCGWSGSRQPNANTLPCPDCGADVYVSARSKGRPKLERVRVQLWIPTVWHSAMQPDVNDYIRGLIRADLEGKDAAQ